MIKILTWLWSKPGSRTNYTAHHVNIWAAMVSRHLTIPHTLACVTDMPEGIDPHIEIIKPPGEFVDWETPTWNNDKPNCFRRLTMFSPHAAEIFGADRFVCMDLDCTIGANIDALFDRDDDFVMYRGTSFDRPYNGSLMMIKAGSRPQVYTDFNYENAVASGQKYVGSDQAWIAYCLGVGEKTWSFEDGICWYGSQYNRLIDVNRIMFYPGQMKPWEISINRLNKWVMDNYVGDKGDKECLILGYSKNVWKELEEVIDKRTTAFDNYIISPEVEKYWTLGYMDKAADDAHAIALAKMYGYKNITFVGKS